MDLPQYRCHKVVQAAKIVKVEHLPEAGALLFFEGITESQLVSRDFLTKHQPQVGGYFVVYKDGYTSFSPSQAFEEGYSLIEEN